MGQTQADSTNSRDAVVLVHMIGSLRATCQPCQTSVIGGRKKKKEWESDSASQSHNIDTSQIEIVQTGLLQRHERDANQHGTNVGLSLDGQDEDMVT